LNGFLNKKRWQK